MINLDHIFHDPAFDLSLFFFLTAVTLIIYSFTFLIDLIEKFIMDRTIAIIISYSALYLSALYWMLSLMLKNFIDNLNGNETDENNNEFIDLNNQNIPKNYESTMDIKKWCQEFQDYCSRPNNLLDSLSIVITYLHYNKQENNVDDYLDEKQIYLTHLKSFSEFDIILGKLLKKREHDSLVIISKYLNRKQYSDEKYDSYYSELNKWIQKAYKTRMTSLELDQVLRDKFISGLDDLNIRNDLVNLNVKSSQEALNLAMDLSFRYQNLDSYYKSYQQFDKFNKAKKIISIEMKLLTNINRSFINEEETNETNNQNNRSLSGSNENLNVSTANLNNIYENNLIESFHESEIESNNNSFNNSKNTPSHVFAYAYGQRGILNEDGSYMKQTDLRMRTNNQFSQLNNEQNSNNGITRHLNDSLNDINFNVTTVKTNKGSGVRFKMNVKL